MAVQDGQEACEMMRTVPQQPCRQHARSHRPASTTSTHNTHTRRLLWTLVVLLISVWPTHGQSGTTMGTGSGPWNTATCRTPPPRGGGGTSSSQGSCPYETECLPNACTYECYDPTAWNCTTIDSCPSGEICVDAAASGRNATSGSRTCIECETCWYTDSDAVTRQECFDVCGPCLRRGPVGSACEACSLSTGALAITAAGTLETCTSNDNCSQPNMYCARPTPGCGLTEGVCTTCEGTTGCLYGQDNAINDDCFEACGGCQRQGTTRSACSECDRNTTLDSFIGRLTSTQCDTSNDCSSGLYCANSTDCGPSLCSLCDYCLYVQDDATTDAGLGSECLEACGGCTDLSRVAEPGSACENCNPGPYTRPGWECTNHSDCITGEYCGTPDGCGAASFCAECTECMYIRDDTVDGASCFDRCGSCVTTGAPGSACASFQPPAGELCGDGLPWALDWGPSEEYSRLSHGKTISSINRSRWALDQNYYLPAINVSRLCVTTTCGDQVVVSNFTGVTLPQHWYELSSWGSERNFSGFFVDSSVGTVIGTPTLPAGQTMGHMAWALIMVTDRSQLLQGCPVTPSLVYNPENTTGLSYRPHCSDNNVFFEVYRTNYTVQESDLSNPINGPNGGPCRNGGTPVDNVEFNGRFRCDCYGTNFQGPNCGQLAKLSNCSFTQPTASSVDCVQEPCAFDTRTQWAINSTYRVARWEFTGGCQLHNSTINITSTTYEIRNNPPGVCIDGTSGAITVNVNQAGDNTTTQIVASLQDDGGLTWRVPVANMTFDLRVRDLDNPAAVSANGRPCDSNGTERTLDNTTESAEFDLRVECVCRRGFTGVSCSTASSLAYADDSDDVDGSVLLGVLIPLALIVIGVAIVLAVALRRWRHDRYATVDFTDAVFRDALPPKYAALGPGETTACKCPDGPACRVGMYARDTPREIKRSRIVQVAVDAHIGTGEFGSVTRRIFNDDLAPPGAPNPRAVAVKELRPGASGTDRQRFLVEAFITAQFHHENVVSLVGVVTAGEAIDLPIFLVLELCERGSLDRLLGRLGANATIPTLFDYCAGVARGMHYLTMHSFIHRDLAARNVLVDEDNRPKVADFGLTRDLDSNYYYRSTDDRARVPLRWTSPEAVLERKFSEASDVWAFGVTVWEIFSCAATPYGELTNDQLIERIIRRSSDTNDLNNTVAASQFDSLLQRHSLQRPVRCPRALYNEVMAPCLNIKPAARPTFAKLTELFDNPDTRHRMASPTSDLSFLDDDDAEGHSHRGRDGGTGSTHAHLDTMLLQPPHASDTATDTASTTSTDTGGGGSGGGGGGGSGGTMGGGGGGAVDARGFAHHGHGGADVDNSSGGSSHPDGGGSGTLHSGTLNHGSLTLHSNTSHESSAPPSPFYSSRACVDTSVTSHASPLLLDFREPDDHDGHHGGGLGEDDTLRTHRRQTPPNSATFYSSHPSTLPTAHDRGTGGSPRPSPLRRELASPRSNDDVIVNRIAFDQDDNGLTVHGTDVSKVDFVRESSL